MIDSHLYVAGLFVQWSFFKIRIFDNSEEVFDAEVVCPNGQVSFWQGGCPGHGSLETQHMIQWKADDMKANV